MKNISLLTLLACLATTNQLIAEGLGAPQTPLRLAAAPAQISNTGWDGGYTDFTPDALARGTGTAITLDDGVITITDHSQVGIDNEWTLKKLNASTFMLSDASGAAIDVSGMPGASGSGSSAVTIPASSLSSSITAIVVNGGEGDDVLTVDFSGGNFDAPITFNGGGQTMTKGGDAMALTGGGTFDTATYGFANKHDGTVGITGNALITYTGLEPITSSIDATNATLNFSTASETMDISDAGGGQTSIASTAGEIVTFNHPTGTLTVNAGITGDDLINVNSLAANYPAHVIINGEGPSGTDTVRFNGAVSLAAGRNLTVTADVISDTNTTTPDITAASVSLNGNLAPGASPGIFSVAGDVSLGDSSAFTVEVGGTTPGNTGANHDQLDATGSVSIGNNVALSLGAVGGFVPGIGQSFKIINRTGGTGTFSGLPEGAAIPNFLGSGLTATITYTGGNGDDVVVFTSTAEIAVFTGASTAVVDERTNNVGTISFASVPIIGGSSAAQIFTIKNTGPDSLTGLAASSTSADFTILQPLAATLATGETTTFSVTFSPKTAGARSGVINLASNDADENPFRINVDGTAASATTGSTGGSSPVDVTQPTLGVQWVIAVQGLFPSRSGTPSDPADEEAMVGEIRCMAFDASVLNAAWLPCDGRLMPISQYTALFSLLGTNYGGDGRTSFGLPDLRGRVPVGVGAGYQLGQKSGAQSVSLTQIHLPAHTHTTPPGSTGSTGSASPQAYNNEQPWLALNICIQTTGVFDSIGWVRIFGFNFSPGGFLPCTGGTCSVNSYTTLFSKILTIYGGDGETTFGIPDLGGRSSVGTGTGPGLSPRLVGTSGGSVFRTLAVNQLPAHHHSLNVGNTGDTGSGLPIDKMQPFLVMNHAIALAGIYGGSDFEPALGEMRWFAGDITSASFSTCDGQILPINVNQALYSLLGTTYGGDGETTLALPDLRGRLSTSLGAGPGLPPRRLGDRWGAESYVLSLTEMPAHTHSYNQLVDAPEIVVSGNGISITDGDITPNLADHTDFGSTAVGTPVTRTFTITNTGPVELNLGAITVPPAGYTIVAPFASATVAPLGGATTISVRCDAATQGTNLATLSIVNDDADENPFNFAITCNVQSPTSPVSSTLGDVVSGESAPDGTGASDGTVFGPLLRGGFIAENGNLVFPGQLEIGTGGVTISPNNFQGYWKHNGSLLTRLVRSGEAAPETGATPALFNVLPLIPGINDDGQVTLLASLVVNPASTPPTTNDNDTGLWSELGDTGFQILIREGDNIPGVAGVQLGAFGTGCFATARIDATHGEAAFPVTFRGASTDTALLRCSVVSSDTTAVQVVARENAAAPGVAGESFGFLNSSYTDAVRMDAQGGIAFGAALNPSGKASLWYQPRGGALVKGVVAGDAAPGTTATFQSMDVPRMGGGGTFAFRGVLNADGDNALNDKNDGIWRGTAAGGFANILRRGDTNANRPGLFSAAYVLANPAVKAGNIYSGWLTNSNLGAWLGWVDLAGDGINSYPADTFGVYTDMSGTMNLLIASGDAAPGIAGATMFFLDHPVVGGADHLAFIATVTGGGTTAGVNDKGIWRSTGGAAPTLVIRTGDTITTTQGVKTIADVDLPGSNDASHRWELRLMDGTGRLIVFVTFTDTTTTEVLVP